MGKKDKEQRQPPATVLGLYEELSQSREPVVRALLFVGLVIEVAGEKIAKAAATGTYEPPQRAPAPPPRPAPDRLERVDQG